jgi:hypothetical protein
MTRIYRYFFLLFSLALSFAACTDDETFTTDANAKLDFSSDTLRFDTVFTQRGSAVRYIKLINNNDQAIRVSKIYLAKGSQSKFTLNVDGIPGRAFEEVEIYAKDSIYLFATVSIDPNQPLSVSPFVVEEKIVFETNGNVQEVSLEAWGQNANYFPSRFNGGQPVVLSCRNSEITFNDPKPYVFYGAVFIDSCTVNIPAGTRIYVHGGVAKNELFGIFNDGLIYVLRNGRLVVKGTKEKPVVIQGDRLEESFQDDQGQWNGIFIGRGSRGNSIEYATVKNSNIGVYVDSSAQLTLRHSRFFNTAGSGLLAVHSTVTAENCLFYNNQVTSVNLSHGGDYNFTYCTMVSYGIRASALGMNNFRCYTQDCSVANVYRLNANFRNCIIYGSDRDEMELSDGTQGRTAGVFNIKFQNCIVRVQDLIARGQFVNFLGESCDPCINGKASDKVFKDPNKDDYRLDSLSIAQNYGRPITVPRAITLDIENVLRNAQTPDPGCFERQQ